MKQISERARTTLAKVMVALDERTSDDDVLQASALHRARLVPVASTARLMPTARSQHTPRHE